MGKNNHTNRSVLGTFSNYETFQLGLFLVIISCIVVISLTYFALSVGRPYMGVTLSLEKQGWQVESVDANGVASQARITQGDVPFEINGQPAGLFLASYSKAGMVFGNSFKELVVESKSGEIKTAVIANSRLGLRPLTQQISWVIISIVFWIAGLYVFLKKPRHVAASILCLFSVAVGLALSGNLGAAIAVSTAAELHVIAYVVAPWLLLHFFIVLPEERFRIRKKVILIYFPVALTIILLPLVGWSNGQPVLWFRTLRLLEAGFGLIAAVGVAILNYFSAVSARTRQQMRIVLLSALAAIIPVLLLNVLPFAITRETIIPPGLSLLFVGFIPLGMGYAVITQRLMDIDIVIRRGIVYASISLVMTAILSIVLFAVLEFQAAFGTGERVFLALAAGLLATVLFGPTKKWAEVLVDRIFYKDRYDYRHIIDALSNSLKLLKDPVEISRVLIGTAVRTLNLAGSCLFIKVSGSFELGACQGNLGTPDMQYKLSEFTYERKSESEFPNSGTIMDPDLRFIIPLVAGEKEVGILYLSHKISKQEFSSDDMYLLQGMASVGAMALQSAMLVRDVSVRDTFVSIASHELRTPLTAVIGYSDLLLRRDPPEATRKQWLQTILDSGLKIAEMADDLLDVSRIRSGKIALKIEKIQLQPILSEQVIAAGSFTDKHNFVFDVAPDIHQVFVDRNKLGQILANILNNAVKYSPNGGRITVSAKNEVEANRVVVSVSDEGLGISPADKESLFKTFHRIQRQETIGIRGIGLGLYIVKEWTEAMNGKVWFDSELNKGSTFYLALPTQQSEKNSRVR